MAAENRWLSENENEAKNNGAVLPTLNPQQKEQAKNISKQLDGLEAAQINTYGNELQNEVADFSKEILDIFSDRELNDISSALYDLIFAINDIKPSELMPQKENIISKLIGTQKRLEIQTVEKYNKIREQISKSAEILDQQCSQLDDDNQVFDRLYQQNIEYYQRFNLYIAGAEIKEKDISVNNLAAAKKRVEKTKNRLDQQTVDEVNFTLESLRQRTNELKLLRQIVVGQAPKIRQVQKANEELISKVGSLVSDRIPLWKNWITISLNAFQEKNSGNPAKGKEYSQPIFQAANRLLSQSSQILKDQTNDTIENEKQAAKMIADLEDSLKHLLDEIQQTIDLQNQGKKIRSQAKNQLNSLKIDVRSQISRTPSELFNQKTENPAAEAESHEQNEKEQK